MSALVTAATFGVGVTLGWALKGGDAEAKAVQNTSRARRLVSDGWAIYVEGTSDPDEYVAVYEQRGRTRYEVSGRGVSNALRNLAEKIEAP